MDNVSALPGYLSPPDEIRRANADCIKLLSAALQSAIAGEMTGCAIVIANAQGATDNQVVGLPPQLLFFELDMLKLKLLSFGLEARGDVHPSGRPGRNDHVQQTVIRPPQPPQPNSRPDLYLDPDGPSAR